MNNLHYFIKFLFYFISIDKSNHKLENLNSKPLFKLRVLHQKKVFYLFCLLEFGLNEQTDKHRRAGRNDVCDWRDGLMALLTHLITAASIQSVTSDK